MKSDRAEGLDTEGRKVRSTVFEGPLPISSIFCVKPGSLALRIGVISLIVLKRGHKGDDFTEAYCIRFRAIRDNQACLAKVSKQDYDFSTKRELIRHYFLECFIDAG
jgi:hypothetical protein